MRRIIAAAVGTFTIAALISGAQAADIPRAAPEPYRAPVAVPYFSWTGFYAGINGGYGWGDANWSSLPGDFSTSGGTVGGTIGYNWQTPGTPWVFGLEGDINWAGIDGNVGAAQTSTDWFGTVRGRIGYSFDRVMPYITGGLAFGNIESSVAGLPKSDSTEVGWTLGGGIETAFAPNWSAKLEYLYVDLGSAGCSAASCFVPTNVDHSFSVVRAGLNYRF